MFFAVPPSGLVVYCGTIVTEEGKEKKVNIDFEPFKPINTSLYLCDNKFHTEVKVKTECFHYPKETTFCAVIGTSVHCIWSLSHRLLTNLFSVLL